MYEKGIKNPKVIFKKDIIDLEKVITLDLIYAELLKEGFDKKYSYENLFPDWFKRLSKVNSSNLVNLNSFLKEKIFGTNSYSLQYKKNNTVTNPDLTLATKITIIAAKSMIGIIKKPFKAIPKDPKQIINILKKKAKIITLESMVNYLWESGIPVIFVSNFPKAAKK